MRLITRSLHILRNYSTDAPKVAPTAKKLTSICPAGTKLTGLKVTKNGEEPVALAEEEYPEWLWQVLDESAQKKKLEEDPEKQAARDRRQTNRKAIKTNNFLASMSK